MVTKKKFKLKKPIIKVLKIIGVILGIVFAIFLFYRSQINDLKEIGYSEKAAKNILMKMKKEDVLALGKNETLNIAFESSDYKEKNFDSYAKIKYKDEKYLISNINMLIKRGYNNDEINIILAHGSGEDIKEFAKRDKVRYLEEFYTYDYAKIKYYDRYVKYMDENREDEETSILLVNLGMDKTEYEDPTVVKEFSNDMLVNKYRMLEKDYVPDDLVSISKEDASSDDLKSNRTAYIAFKQMKEAAEKEGYHLIINSAYRSYEDQEEITNAYLNLYGQSYVDRYVSKPGYSEHQTGLAFDIGSTDTNVFANSDEYTWIVDNCYKYGFIYRFKSEYESITGYRHEAWHYRYVGKKIAKEIYEKNISLEEYYAIYLDD